MKIFISYGSTDDQVTALRLQTLAAVNGLSVYVPPAHTRPSSVPGLFPESAQVSPRVGRRFGREGTRLSNACSQELNIGLASGKPTLVMATPTVAAQLQLPLDANLIVIDPSRPAAESHDVEQNTKKALIALGTLALGLLIFAPRD